MALMTTSDPHHHAVRDWLATLDDDLVTSPLAVAEMDHFAVTRGGEVGRDALHRNLENGAFGVRWWADALRETLEIARRHPAAGLTDASLVALAGLLRTNRIATFDQHFRAMMTSRGESFVLLPTDA